MESKRHAWTRRSVLRRGGLAVAGASLGVPAVSEAASAEECCKVCWMDVKPGCCPNRINAGKNEVVTIYVGWPNVKPDSIRLVPSATGPTFDTPTCQRYRNPDWKRVSCADIDGLLSKDDRRGAKPCNVSVRNVDGDADNDTVVKVCSCDLGLRRNDRTLLLEAETGSGCRLLAIDSVVPCNCGTANRH